MRVPFLLSACLLLPSLGVTQNLVKNGDFEATQLTPWTQSGPGVNPGVFSFDTNGTGLSRSYAVNPGSNQVHSITQTVVIAPIPYEFSLDAAVQAGSSAFSIRLPTVTIKLGTATVTSHQFVASRQNPTRRRLCARITPKQAGPQSLTIEFLYPSPANAGSPRAYVDNVDLRVALDPTFCISGERSLGMAMSFDVQGAANAPFVVFVAPKLLPNPIQIPGIGGALELDPTLLVPLLTGKLDASGSFSLSVTVPSIAGLAGVPLFWQGLEVDSTGPALGWASLIGFY